MTDTRELTLGDLFTAVRGQSRYTIGFAESHPGPFPIYSASLRGPMAYADTYDYGEERLSFTTNGYAGTVQVLAGEYSINADRALLVPHEADFALDLDYLGLVIEPVLRPLAVGRKVDGLKNEYTKLSPEVALSATIRLPTDNNGQLDLEAMHRTGEEVRRARRLQANVRARLETIVSANVLIDCSEPRRELSLGDSEYFRLSIGKRLLKSEMVTSGVPVYSANVRTPFGFAADSPLRDLSRPSLTWGIDGIFDWSLVEAEVPFVPTDHCGRAEILTDDLDPEYLLHELRSTRDELGFDRIFRANLANVRAVKIWVPTDSNGVFDLDRQRQLAKRHREIGALRDAAVGTLAGIVESRYMVAAFPESTLES